MTTTTTTQASSYKRMYDIKKKKLTYTTHTSMFFIWDFEVCDMMPTLCAGNFPAVICLSLLS